MKITLENLTKVFSNKKRDTEVIAVNAMNIEIPDGELVGLLGPSGCGKSTTLFMLSGLEAPSSGKIYFGDQDVTDLSPEKKRYWFSIPKLCFISSYDSRTKYYVPIT